MILDITGIELTPGNNGENCFGNGKHYHKDGSPIECCCDECDYMQCCFIMNSFNNCKICDDTKCPHYETKKTDTTK